MTVITISRQYGSGGDEIAVLLGQALQYQDFDKRLILQAAAESGLSDQEIMDFSEESHQARGFFERLFSPRQVPQVGRVWREDASGARVMEEVPMSEEVLLSLMQRAIRGAVRAGQMIIVGRGGQAVLRDEPGVLHVRVEAPMEDRIQRLKETLRSDLGMTNTDIELRRMAQDRIVERDAASADYLKRFYRIDWADPLLYHVVLNTGRLTVEQAAHLIVALVRAMEAEQALPA
jgi:CMP/dCMP kinase